MPCRIYPERACLQGVCSGLCGRRVEAAGLLLVLLILFLGGIFVLGVLL